MVENRCEIGQNLLVAAAKDAIAISFEMFGAGCVLPSLEIVDGAIDLNDQVGGGAVEVEHKWPDCVLAAKAQPSDLSAPQCFPKHPLGRRQLAAESLCILQERSRDPANALLCPIASHTTPPTHTIRSKSPQDWGDLGGPRGRYPSATTGFSSAPIPSISTRITSPG